MGRMTNVSAMTRLVAVKHKRRSHHARGAKIWQHGNSKQERHNRDENLRRIRKVGRKTCQHESGYHRRSLAETTMFRFKMIFGSKLRSRKFDNQAVELFLQCAARGSHDSARQA